MYCEICEEIQTGSSRRIIGLLGANHKDRVLWSCSDFVAMPSIAPIVPGHLVVFTKTHFPSLSVAHRALPKYSFDSLLETVRRWDQRKTLLIWEHGSDGMTCGINHAHLNIVPLAGNSIPSDLIRSEGVDFLSGISVAPEDKAYLLLGSLHRAFLHVPEDMNVINPKLTSQFVRRILVKQWDLKSHSDWKQAKFNDPKFSESEIFCKETYS